MGTAGSPRTPDPQVRHHGEVSVVQKMTVVLGAVTALTLVSGCAEDSSDPDDCERELRPGETVDADDRCDRLQDPTGRG